MSEFLTSELRKKDGFQLLDGNEFVEWHKQGKDRSLIWSTHIDLPELISTVCDTFGNASPDVRGNIMRENARTSLPSSELIPIIEADAAGITSLRLSFVRGVAFLWSRTPDNPNIRSASPYPEASSTFTRTENGFVTETVRKTATDRIGRLATTIVNGVAS